MIKDELNDFFRQLAKSTVSENFRESVTSNYTPRVSHRVLSEQEVFDPEKDSAEVTPSYHRPDSPNRPSSFVKKKGFIRDSAPDRPTTPDPMGLLLLLSVENERLRSELDLRVGELEALKGVLDEMVRDSEERTRVEAENRVRGVVKKFVEEKAAWESELRRIRELLDQKARDLAIALQNTEKLRTAVLDLERANLGYKSEIERMDKGLRGSGEIEQWKARNSKLELGVIELQRRLEAVVAENVGRVGGLLRENEAMRTRTRDMENKVALLSVELERLTVVSGRKLEENDQLKQKVNKLEILVTELRIAEGKLQKQLNELKRL